MSIVGDIKNLYSDVEKTRALFPTTKIEAVSDEDGTGLNVILDKIAYVGHGADQVKNLYADRTETQAIFPTTKVKAVSDENGRSLDVLLDDKASKDFVTTKIAEAQLGGGGSDCADGFSPIATVVPTEDGALITITDKNGTTMATVKNGADGSPGSAGKDGTSVTHSWSGTTLSVTSASGTSSANLKGEKGDKGDKGDSIKGDKGDTGAAGTSVTVKSVSESTTDGGSNVVTFSDGKTVTVKNGSKGSKGDKGDTGATGPAYTLTSADKAEMVEDVLEAMDGVPSYWQTALDNGVEAINTALCEAGRNKSAFLFYSDAHWNYGSQMSPTLLKYLHKHTGMAKTFFGGDIVNDEASDYDTMEYLWEWRKQLKDLPNHHSVVGNHDDGNATNNLFSEQYVYGYLLAAEETPGMMMGDGLYYYVDSPAEKTRYLCLDTAYKGVTTAEQEFVKAALLSTPENWHIVAIAHLWYHNDYTTYPPVLNGFDTNAKILLDMFDNFNTRQGAFAECTAWVEFCIGGHYHLDHVEHTSGGIPVIIVEADTLHDRSGTMPKAGTTDESAISAVIADYNTKTVKVIRVGRGADYETTINVKTVSYTNVIPLSIDSTGAIFNGGKGWADKGRIGSGKLDSYIGGGDYYITGHIEIDPTIDNTIRMKNITFKSDTTIDKIGIAFYDASFTRVLMDTNKSGSNWLSPSTIANITDDVLDGTNIVQFTLENGLHLNNTAIKYFAICAEYIGDDSIITINEPID